jgi:acyl-coenzyme A thioesterase PaaI-like protein
MEIKFQMKFSSAALQILGYTRRSNTWNDFVTRAIPTWYKFSPDHIVSNFATYTTESHRNVMSVTHGGVLMTFMDYCMAAAVWDLTNGKNAFTIELNNRFVHTARLKRWLFGEIKIIEIGEIISLTGEIRANDPYGMLIMSSEGKFTLPKEPKRLDDSK